jgi:NAD(P)-dependent dehydrogenase (short-subunit alcohol dehydrogenase family)
MGILHYALLDRQHDQHPHHLVAEVYGMRGATVAVLDVNDMENGEAKGVTFYKCDVTDKARLAQVAKDIERDVSNPISLAVQAKQRYKVSVRCADKMSSSVRLQC